MTDLNLAPEHPDGSEPRMTPSPAETLPDAASGGHDSGLYLHRDPSLGGIDPRMPGDEGAAADPRRRVEWVRPTDLFARLSARAAERGVEWNERAMEWTKEQARSYTAEMRAKGVTAARSLSARLTRTGPEPVDTESVRL